MPAARVLLINQYFWPDWAATAQLLSDLAQRAVDDGVEVEALTGRGSYAREDRRPLAKRERWCNVEIRRVWCTDFGRSSTAGRALDYATFLISAGLRVVLGPRADVVVCLSTPPLVAVLGWVAQLRGSRFLYKVEDLYPDVAVALGTLRERSPLTALFRRLSRLLLRSADACVALDGAMKEALLARGASRVEIIPNWADGEAIFPDEQAGREYGQQWELGDNLIVLYSGNLGQAHRFDAVCEAARELDAADAPVLFLFVGGGPRSDEVRRSTVGLANVRFHPYQPRERLHELYNAAHIHLVTLRDEVSGMLVPSKYPAALASGKPVLLVGGSGTDIEDEIRDTRLGWVCPHDSVAVLQALDEASRDRGSLDAAGARGRKVFEATYSRRACLDRWLALIDEMAAASQK